jgi:hypothetical protein
MNATRPTKELLPSFGPGFASAFGALSGVNHKDAALSFGNEMSCYGGATISGPHGHATERPDHWECVRPTGYSTGSVVLRQYHSRKFHSLRSVCMFLMGLDNGPKEGMPQTFNRAEFPAELS